jgi:putative transcriptional regulator
VSDEFQEKIAGEIALSADPGKTMRKWREEFGISQHQLAESMGISHSVISDYEAGRRKSPGVAVIKKMVEAFIAIDEAAGSPTISKYRPDKKEDCVIAMDEFPGGIPMDRFIKWITGKNLNPNPLPQKKVYGYTIVDSVKAILSLGSGDYMKIYGWSIERALIFTNVHYGRSPMVAIRAHPLTPAVVVYDKPDNTDPLAVKLAMLEGVPLVTTELEIKELAERLKDLKDRI